MVHLDPTSNHPDPTLRPPSEDECIYWDGNVCVATDYFPKEDISCYHDGNCDGFGKCRGCTKYDQGGLKLDVPDGQGGTSQTPMNLKVYNIRARIQPCCHWDGPPVDFTKKTVKTDLSTNFVSEQGDNPNKIIAVTGSIVGFDRQGILEGKHPGTDDFGEPLPTIVISYTGKDVGSSSFTGVTATPNSLRAGYVLTQTRISTAPIFKVAGSSPDSDKGEQVTFCDLSVATPWQEGLTEENPSFYGCNGAKPECPFYTGPLFTEAVDSKMDIGNRVTAKQIMELRYYSEDWKSFANPREVWESRFEQPDIWAWARDPKSKKNHPGTGLFGGANEPLLQKVTIEDFSNEEPVFVVSPPVFPTTGTPVVGLPPDYPTLIRELFLTTTGFKIIWPKDTSISEPLVRHTFTANDRFIYISVLLNTDREAFAINLTKHPQGGISDTDFVNQVKLNAPEDVFEPTTTGLPNKTFIVKLVHREQVSKLNRIRIFLDIGNSNGEMLKADIYVNHIFHHAHVKQTEFNDFYGHTMVDPWINHFTRTDIKASILNITNNVSVDNILWNTVASNGKKTIYAIETQKTVSSNDTSEIEWEGLNCNHIAVTFKNNRVNRVHPWKAWGKDSKGVDLFVKMDRSGNPNVASDLPTEIEMEFVFASTKGSAIPANMAVFKIPTDEAVQKFDPSLDVLTVRYAYTEYKQGPISEEDISKLKFPSDIERVIETFPYEVNFSTNQTSGDTEIIVEGTFIKTNSSKFFTCDDIIGNCYTEKALSNELLAREVFFGGGLQEDSVDTNFDMISKCAQEFDSAYSQEKFEDGTSVTFTEAVNRLKNIHLLEGSQDYSIIFNDKEGRPIGTKVASFLTQSATVQARDVEIRYKWEAPIEHYAINDRMKLLAVFAERSYASIDRLVITTILYDPFCGDHKETTVGNPQYGSFSLGTDEHGPLWYPYNRCLTPSYHADDSLFTNPIKYSDVVEGFDKDKRRNYWERMRVWDKYMPAIMNWIPQLGCNWSETDTNIHAFPPFNFAGYTSIRSLHPFGAYSVDREVLRVSRHWEKRNLSIIEETIKQEDDGLTVDLTDEFSNALFDETGNLKIGATQETSVWVHMQDGLSPVSPTIEEKAHPFSHLLLQRVGTHTFNEVFSSARIGLEKVFEERDYTSTLDRSEDGTVIYLADGTTLNTPEGIIEEDQGTDARWVYKQVNEEDVSGFPAWAWLADPPEPIRSFNGGPRITGLFTSNPANVFFKKNFRSATHTTEGEHKINYIAHEFDDFGNIVKSASLDMDGGPPLFISQTNGNLFLLSSVPAPYDPLEHIGEDYNFALYGKGPGGLGILADSRGLQRHEVAGKKFATLAGVSINLVFDINELPYNSTDIRFLLRDGIDATEALEPLIKTFEADDTTPKTTGIIDLKGHYYVETVTVNFTYGDDADIPIIKVEGVLKDDPGLPIGSSASLTTLATSTSYIKGTGALRGSSSSESLSINRRVQSLKVSFGARSPSKRMIIDDIKIILREHVDRTETVKIFEPKVQISTGQTGTHIPSQLEFYFQRTFPDFAKDYVFGQLSIPGALGQDVTKIAGTQVKFLGRRVKDLVPSFEFTDPINNRFPYNNIDITAIPGYKEESTVVGTLRYIDSSIKACSKGWTMATTGHEPDPFGSLTHKNSFNRLALEDAQRELYNSAGGLLGDKVTVYKGFFHPEEVDFFKEVGVDLSGESWTLTMSSVLAPIERVFRHENYGCDTAATNEYLDGTVHKLENWQARGVWTYACNPAFNWTCLAVVMNKCDEFLFLSYGTDEYLINDVVSKYTYVFAFPPNELGSWIAAGLIDKAHTYVGGVWGGFNPTTASHAAYSRIPTFIGSPLSDPFLGLKTVLNIKNGQV